jgi:L-aminopeptidase/D-esterase-like protein
MRTAALILALVSAARGQSPRARDLGVPFEGTPGARNAITDVAGVAVGHATIIRGEGRLVRGQGPVRTGVTAVFPRGKDSSGVFAGWFSQNGNGEMTGAAWIAESGQLDGPVLITNTTSVGTVRDAYIAWQIERSRDAGLAWLLPVVAETYDGYLNDIHGFHVKPEHVRAALDGAAAGPVPEGNVGGGTGMICFGFKGGIGNASRKAGAYTVGVLVQCNCGRRPQLTIAGVPVGREIGGSGPYASNQPGLNEERGSIIIVVATDAPLLPHQLERLTRRATMGLARVGATSGNGSGDIFLAFSTANADAARGKGVARVAMLANEDMNPLFDATVQATEEAIVNSMVAAETMTGADGHTVERLPHAKLREALKKYGRN